MNKIKGKFSVIIILILIILSVIKIFSLIIKENGEDSLPYKAIPKENVCVALNYHRVRENKMSYKIIEKLTGSPELTTYNVYEDDFEKQIDFLIKEGAYFATPEELVKFRETGIYPEKCVWISFDDGDQSIYKVAYPILKKRNIPFTIFVIAGQVGNEDFNGLNIATWDELREMKDSGLVTFGSHTYNMHYLEDDRAIFLDKDSYREFYKDINKSKKVLEKELGTSVDIIAYPFGETSDDITNIVKESGFSNAYILSPNPITIDNDPYYQNRYIASKDVFNNLIIPWLENK